ncbi:MAG: gluconokinase [Pseudomonadota bacterium]|nr:gluconokinase [Pseudomonadota bacterium]
MTGPHVVVMGVAGCGKSALGQRLAQSLGLPLIEGDSFHPPANVGKMRQGVALTDADRAEWLAQLARELAGRPHGAVLTCSALKRDYRDRLRAAMPGLRFVHLALDQGSALERVRLRAGHFYPPSLVASQFETLEDPSGESGVVVVDALQPLDAATGRALAGLGGAGLARDDPTSVPAG